MQDGIFKDEIGCFAKVMPDSYWDSIASDEIDDTVRERLDLILDAIDNYY